MNIKSMLMRLQAALERDDLAEQMILSSGKMAVGPTTKDSDSESEINLVVGYNRSLNSQTALDLLLWMAHQTRIATHKQVTVHIVYVINANQNARSLALSSSLDSSTSHISPLEPSASIYNTETISSGSRMTTVEPSYFRAIFSPSYQLELASQILEPAQSLAEEWGVTFITRLQVGDLATELRRVVELEKAALLFLGCSSSHDPLIRSLGADFPCPVLGIPTNLTTKHTTPRTRELTTI